MLYFLVFTIASKYIHKCESDLKHPPFVENGNLRQLLVLTRHGCRSPYKYYEGYEPGNKWNCDSTEIFDEVKMKELKAKRRFFPPSCLSAELTDRGKKQHFDLGSFYRHYLIDEMNLLDKKFSNEEILIRSSDSYRCLLSAESFIRGMFPDIDLLHDVNISYSKQGDLLRAETYQCQEFRDVYDDWIKSAEFIMKKEKAKSVLYEIINRSNVVFDDIQWLWVGDWLLCTECCIGHRIDVPDELRDIAIDANKYFTTDLYQQKRGIIGAPIVRELMNVITKFNDGENRYKFALFSAHDVTLTAVLNLIGVNINFIPPFRSHLAFEVWDVNSILHIRISFNGEIVHDLTTLSDFEEKISPYLNQCLEMN